MEERLERLGHHGVENDVHIGLLKQQEQQLHRHGPGQPQEHPIKDLIVLALAAFAFTLLKHY